MKRFILAAIAAASLAVPSAVSAQESQAKSWGLTGEEMAVLSGRVVDIMCELSGDCPDDCGGGDRQLGLVTIEGQLVAVGKNTQTSFNGAVEDLLPYCNKDVDVDGLWVGHSGFKFYQVQFIREQGASEFSKANLWTGRWAEKFPDAQGQGPWFRRDPRVLKHIEERGYLGLGDEADTAFIKDWY